MTVKDKTAKSLVILGIFTFIISPAVSWISVISTDETAVFASLSRMIWFSGDALRIFIAMMVLFLTMLTSFFLACRTASLSRTQNRICRCLMIVSCAILYIGAMELMPSDGKSMTSENIWHGILSFGGIFMIFLTFCVYAVFNIKKDREGTLLVSGMLLFTLITSAFSVLNVFDDKSYVVASAIAELYVLTMFSLTGFMTYYLAYRKMTPPGKPDTAD